MYFGGLFLRLFVKYIFICWIFCWLNCLVFDCVLVSVFLGLWILSYDVNTTRYWCMQTLTLFACTNVHTTNEIGLISRVLCSFGQTWCVWGSSDNRHKYKGGRSFHSCECIVEESIECSTMGHYGRTFFCVQSHCSFLET